MEAPRRVVRFQHVRVKVREIEEATGVFGQLFQVKVRGAGSGMAFIDAGDQFIALAEERTQSPDEHRHIGIVVDDKRPIRRALKQLDVEILPGRGLDFLDPWGNRWQVVQYSEIQFTKAPEVLRGMGLGHLRKTEDALEELRKKGLAPE